MSLCAPASQLVWRRCPNPNALTVCCVARAPIACTSIGPLQSQQPVITAAYRTSISKWRPSSLQISPGARWLTTAPSNQQRQPANAKDDYDQPPEQVAAKFKWYLGRYWYVLLPVHAVNSAVWLGGAYALAYSGVDIAYVVSLLHAFNVPDAVLAAIDKVPPEAGYAATAGLLYQFSGPLPYMTTLAGTMYTVRWLRGRGWLPTAREVKDNAKDFAQKKNKQIQDKIQENTTSDKPPQQQK